MTRPRLRWLLLIPVGLLLLPVVAWAVILTVAPTGWARGKIVAQLSAATGYQVRLHSLNVGLCGGVSLENLEIAGPKSGDDPWLKVEHAKINVNACHLLTGHIEPSEVQVEGVILRVLRRQDGTLELCDLLHNNSPAAPAPAGPSEGKTEPAGLDVGIKDARITVIDEPSQTRLEFDGVEGRASWAGPKATIQKIEGRLNGGPFALTAQLDQSGKAPAFEGQIRARDVALAEGMTALGYLVPVLSGTPDGSLDGKLGMDVYLRGEGIALESIEKSLIGHGSIHLDPIHLDGSKLVAEISRVVPLPPEGRVGSVKTDFAIKDGRISTDDLTLNLGRVPIVLSGWTDFDGKLDYRLKSEDLTEKLPDKARNLLSELDINLNGLTALKVQGTVSALVVTLDGVPLNDARSPRNPAVPKLDDRQRMKELGRQLREKILR